MGYSYTAPPTTVPAGANLWKYQSGSSGDIDLNAAASVTGINAQLPANTAFTMWMRQVGAFFFSAWTYLSGTLQGIVGLSSIGGIRAIVGFIEQSSGHRNVLNIVSNFTSSWEASDNTVRGIMTFDKSQSDIKVEVNGIGTFTERKQLVQSIREDIKTTNVLIAFSTSDTTETVIQRNTTNGNMIMALRQDGAGAGADLATLVLYHGSPQDEISFVCFKDYALVQYATDKNGVNKRMQVKARATLATIEYNDVQLFAVLNDGKLQTNQVETSTGVDATITDRIPVYNTAGVLQGYIPVMVNP